MGQHICIREFLRSGSQGLAGRLSSVWAALAKAVCRRPRRTAEDNVIGNFRMGESFAEVGCRHGHPVRLFNIGRGHFVACDSCRTYVFVGSNLMSNWRQETEDLWRRNSESVAGYEFLAWGGD